MVMGKKDLVLRQQEEISVVWSQVLEHYGKIERTVRKMARVDSRIDEGDLLHDSLVDLRESSHLWSPARGSWWSWARTRIWLCRTELLRKINKDERRDRQSFGPAAFEQGEPVQFDLPQAAGSRGEAARMEAQAELQGLYDRSGPYTRDVILAELQGLSTKSLLGLNSADTGRRLLELGTS